VAICDVLFLLVASLLYREKQEAPASADASRAFERERFYMLPFEQVFVASSHFILAFSQAALVVGILSAAKVGATKPTAKPAATIIVISAFMGVSSIDESSPPNNAQRT
jgi:hypothetical protein